MFFLNRLTRLTHPNAVESVYDYDDAGRLVLLTHQAPLSQALAAYGYSLDRVGNRRTLTETVDAIITLPTGPYQETGGQVVIEAEAFSQFSAGTSHDWQVKSSQSGYTGTGYLQNWPDVGTLYQTSQITASPAISYPVNFTTPGTYTVRARGYAANAAGDSVHLRLAGQTVNLTGFAPRTWAWASEQSPGGAAVTLTIQNSGVYTLNLLMREDGVQIDRLLLTTNTNYIPTGFGPAETARLTGTVTLSTTLDRVIEYDYDKLYRLTEASYSSGELYEYDYDPVGNRLKQIIDGNTTEYTYDAANRLSQVDGQSYTFDDNGNLLNTGVMSNTFDAANRLTQSSRNGVTVQPIYNGVGDRVGQTVGTTTTHFALDVMGLPEVIYTSDDELYLHLPGVIVTKKDDEVRYLLSDGLGSIRQAVDEDGILVAYSEFDPYGNPVQNGSEPYGFTGEWWEEVGLLHLRARWYMPETGTFLSRDVMESEPPYLYVRGNPINKVDPSGLQGELVPPIYDPNRPECYEPLVGNDIRPVGCTLPPQCYVLQLEWDIRPLDCPVPPAGYPYQFTPSPGPYLGIQIDRVWQAGQAALAAHLHVDDGIVFGISGSISHWDVFSMQDLMKWEMIFNGKCFPDSGDTGGIEIVYDFKHQERGIFSYSGHLLNFGSGATGGASFYTGRTRGFANPENTYEIGVDAYAGYFGSDSLSFSFPLGPVSIGRSFIEAVPFDNSQVLNRNGVFATYVADGLGAGIGFPINVDAAVTNYIPLDRERYAPAGLSPDEVIAWKQRRSNRFVTAVRMAAEINVLIREIGGGPFSNRGNYVATAFPNLWAFALR